MYERSAKISKKLNESIANTQKIGQNEYLEILRQESAGYNSIVLAGLIIFSKASKLNRNEGQLNKHLTKNFSPTFDKFIMFRILWGLGFEFPDRIRQKW